MTKEEWDSCGNGTVEHIEIKTYDNNGNMTNVETTYHEGDTTHNSVSTYTWRSLNLASSNSGSSSSGGCFIGSLF